MRASSTSRMTSSPSHPSDQPATYAARLVSVDANAVSWSARSMLSYVGVSTRFSGRFVIVVGQHHPVTTSGTCVEPLERPGHPGWREPFNSGSRVQQRASKIAAGDEPGMSAWPRSVCVIAQAYDPQRSPNALFGSDGAGRRSAAGIQRCTTTGSAPSRSSSTYVTRADHA